MIHLRFCAINHPKSIEETSTEPTDNTGYMAGFESDNPDDINDLSKFTYWSDGVLDVGVTGHPGHPGVEGIR